MEDNQKRKERLNAMRAMATEAGTSSGIIRAETCVVPPLLANPLLETPGIRPVQEDWRATPRFDYYTDPMAAFSGSKKRANVAGNVVSQDYYATPSHIGSPMPRFSSPHPGPRYPQNPPPDHQIQSNYALTGRMCRPQGRYHSATPYRSPRGIANPFPMNQGTLPDGWSVPGDLSSFYGSASHRGMGSPYPMHQGSRSFNHGRGRGAWLGNSAGHGGGGTSGFSRGGGRVRGSNPLNFAPSETLGPERFYDKSMIEDPWQHLEPVVWRGLDCPVNNLNSPASSNSWLPKSISMKKPRVSESYTNSNSKQSLAEYLAASFNEASNDA